MTRSHLLPDPLARLNDANGPVRLNVVTEPPDGDVSTANQPSIRALLGMAIRCQEEVVGSIWLAGTDGAEEFTQDDGEMLAMWSAQAASIIFHARRYEEAHQARADIETMLEECPVAFSVFDVRSGQLSYMNRESRRFVDWVAQGSDGFDDLFITSRFTRPDGRELTFAELPGTRALQSGETVIADEIKVHRPNGMTWDTLVSCAPIFSATGELVSVVTVSQDMTLLREESLRQAEFLGMVSEELRAPLISIKGSAAALRGDTTQLHPTEAQQLVRIIDQQADLMRGQINSLIELTQIETGTLSVVAEPADVAKLIEWSCGEYLREHAAIRIQTDIADGLTAVSADRQQIGKVLHNFLRQAAKHSGESSPVVVSAAMDDIHVAISVSAQGSFNLPEPAHSPLNSNDDPQLFSRVTVAHTKAVELMAQGEGLTMAFNRGVVEAHGGRIRMDVDEPDGLLTLTFTLPSVEDVPEPEFLTAPGARENPPLSLPPQEEDIKILVSIEDPRLLSTVRAELLNAGYDTVSTSDLNQVEELASLERPKLILLDITGREDASSLILRSAGSSLNLPAIVLCDRDDEEYVVRAFEMGADGYMVKPFSPSELIARVKATFRRLPPGGRSDGNRIFQLGNLRIDFDERSVNVSGHPIQLTATEYRLLNELSDSAGRVLTQDALLQRVWGTEYSGEPQLLRSYIKTLRQKLGDDARKPTYIFTEHGVGYRMARPAATANPSGP